MLVPTDNSLKILRTEVGFINKGFGAEILADRVLLSKEEKLFFNANKGKYPSEFIRLP
jgi:hypothetical protein